MLLPPVFATFATLASAGCTHVRSVSSPQLKPSLANAEPISSASGERVAEAEPAVPSPSGAALVTSAMAGSTQQAGPPHVLQDALGSRFEAQRLPPSLLEPATPLAVRNPFRCFSSLPCGPNIGCGAIGLVELGCAGVLGAIDLIALPATAILRHGQKSDIAEIAAACSVKDPAGRVLDRIGEGLVKEFAFARVDASGLAQDVLQLRVNTKRFTRSDTIYWSGEVVLENGVRGTFWTESCEAIAPKRDVGFFKTNCAAAVRDLDALAGECADRVLSKLRRGWESEKPARDTDHREAARIQGPVAPGVIATSRTAGAGVTPTDWSGRDLSVSFRIGMGYGHDAISSRLSPDPASAGLALFVRHRSIIAGPFVDATGGGNGDWSGSGLPAHYTYSGVHVGGAVGASFGPAPWARTELLVEGGGHYVDVENPYTYANQSDNVAWIPFLGLRAAAFVLSNKANIRLGIGLEVGARMDLGRRSMSIGAPEFSIPNDAFQVGGSTMTVQVVAPLEW